jgi:hypothetical protein
MPGIARRTDPLVLHGTLTTFRRRCGKANCRCATGEAHESPALAYTEGGRTKTLTLSDAEVSEVTAALARYDAARAELDASAAAGIAALRTRRSARRAGRPR